MRTISSKDIYDMTSILINGYLCERKCYANINLPTDDFMVFEWEDEMNGAVCNIYLVTDESMMADSVIFNGDVSKVELYKAIVKMINAGCMGKISVCMQGIQAA